MGHVWVISVSFVHSALLAWAFPASSLLLAFYFPFVYMVDQTQMYFTSVSPLRLFQGIICNTERLKGRPWSPELLEGPNLDGGSQTPLHTMLLICKRFVMPLTTIHFIWKNNCMCNRDNVLIWSCKNNKFILIDFML